MDENFRGKNLRRAGHGKMARPVRRGLSAKVRPVQSRHLEMFILAKHKERLRQEMSNLQSRVDQIEEELSRLRSRMLQLRKETSEAPLSFSERLEPGEENISFNTVLVDY